MLREHYAIRPGARIFGWNGIGTIVFHVDHYMISLTVRYSMFYFIVSCRHSNPCSSSGSSRWRCGCSGRLRRRRRRRRRRSVWTRGCPVVFITLLWLGRPTPLSLCDVGRFDWLTDWLLLLLLLLLRALSPTHLSRIVVVGCCSYISC